MWQSNSKQFTTDQHAKVHLLDCELRKKNLVKCDCIYSTNSKIIRVLFMYLFSVLKAMSSEPEALTGAYQHTNSGSKRGRWNLSQLL